MQRKFSAKSQALVCPWIHTRVDILPYSPLLTPYHTPRLSPPILDDTHWQPYFIIIQPCMPCVHPTISYPLSPYPLPSLYTHFQQLVSPLYAYIISIAHSIFATIPYLSAFVYPYTASLTSFILVSCFMLTNSRTVCSHDHHTYFDAHCTQSYACTHAPSHPAISVSMPDAFIEHIPFAITHCPSTSSCPSFYYTHHKAHFPTL